MPYEVKEAKTEPKKESPNLQGWTGNVKCDEPHSSDKK